MKWYNYVAAFFAGAFLVHIVPAGAHVLHNFYDWPHFLLALASLVLGIFFFKVGKVALSNKGALVSIFLGGAVMVLLLLMHHHGPRMS